MAVAVGSQALAAPRCAGSARVHGHSQPPFGKTPRISFSRAVGSRASSRGLTRLLANRQHGWIAGGAVAAGALLVRSVRTKKGGKKKSAVAVRSALKPAEDLMQCLPAGRELEETAQDRVFHWLAKCPAAGTACFEALHKNFPNCLPSRAVLSRFRSVLEEEFGFSRKTTLVGTSFCPDEINNQNRQLPTLMREYYGNVFPMGGIGGVPYVGETGFVAFSSHVPDNGDIVVVFGPHVGISEEGNVGKYLRKGQSSDTLACGAVIGAYQACLGSAFESTDFDGADMQMSEIKQEFAAHAQRLQGAEDPMAACAFQAYEMVKDRMLKIVNTKFGSGRLVLIGGIQINLPSPGNVGHFLPLMFEIRQEGKENIDLIGKFSSEALQRNLIANPELAKGSQREVFSWLQWSPPPTSPVYKSLHEHFPGALPGNALHDRTRRVLEKYGLREENVLLGTSFCPDEINNRPGGLSSVMQAHWGVLFPMGGISGTPFSGETGFAAFSSHVPDDGHIVVAFGPHVGISPEGEVGKCARRGQGDLSTACGAVVGAYNAAKDAAPQQSTGYDMQMDFVKAKIAPVAKKVSEAKNPMAALAHESYDMVKKVMFDTVNNDFGSGYLALLGGIQINMPEPFEDHFYPCTFELRRKGEETVDLISELREFS